MTEFKLVEYDPKYAKAIADMWNVSKEGWNGESDHKTEESVKRKEEISSHLNLYLALDGDKVIGYCKLSKYFAEENTLYVDLLNVDPAYHGKKAGKMLVKKSVERTIELGYPRIDLFTWAGNTKAVPMYKKCGFFWEQMEGGSTHLMNFIPTIIQTELFKDFFKKADWYDDSNRKIDLIPDGVTENGFDYLTYSWQKNGKNLLVEFEKTGRGIRHIETDDYSITSTVEKNKLVFGKDYKINYKIVNKTGKKLEVGIKGLTDKNIKTQADFSGNIKGKKTVEAEFHLDKIEKDQSVWQTHPCVMSEISVNGKKVIFKTGINPQFPLKLKTSGNYSINHAGIEKDLFLDAENNFNEDCTFEITLPKVPEIEFSEYKKTFFMKKGERNTVALKMTLHNSVLICDDIKIKAVFTDGRSYSYRQKFNLVLNTYDGKLYSQNDSYFYMSYGKLSFSLDRHIDCNQMIYRSIASEAWCYMGAPKLGKPFTSEFVRKAPYKSEYAEQHNSITLKGYYRSVDFPGCEFAQIFKMYRSGMLEQWYEIISFPEGSDEFSLSCEFDIERGKVTVPYDGKLVKFDNNAYSDSSLDFMDNDKLSGNWMYSEKDKGTMAMIWPQSFKIKFCSWYLSVEHKFTRSGSMKTEPLIFAADMFSSEKEVREFALHKELGNEQISSSFDLEINAGNPFCSKKISGVYVDFKDKPLDATVHINSVNYPSISFEQKAEKEQNLHKIDFEFKFKGKEPVELISADADHYSMDCKKTKAVFVKNKGKMTLNEDKIEKNTILTAKNGILEIKSSPEFAPSIYSLSFKGREWLASDFPARTNKSWWNNWFGGLFCKPMGIKEHHLIAEKTTAKFVKKNDTFGNTWEGIEVTTSMEKFDALKGIVVKQYFLMMPGYPVLAVYDEVYNGSGFFKEYSQIAGWIYINSGSDLKNIEIKVVENGRENKVKCGFEAKEMNFKSNLVMYKNKTRSEKLHLYNGDAVSYAESISDNAIINSEFQEKRKIKNGETKVFPPKFVIFSELELKEENLTDLQNVMF